MIEEKFVKVVERTANAAISAGRDPENVIHDMIEVIYGRKKVNELLPGGWIIANDCLECAHEDSPGGAEPCYRCYNKFFGASNLYNLDLGPYTNNFTPREEKEEQKSTGKEEAPKEQKHVEVEGCRYCHDCKYEELKIEELPCYNCYWQAARPSFTTKEE